jgi:hypothetical protein
MKRNLLAIVIAIVVTVVLGVPAAFFGGACHCMTAFTAVFPFATTVVMRTSWESRGEWLTLLQFPVYALIIANLNGRRTRLIPAIVILVVHVVASIFALLVVP